MWDQGEEEMEQVREVEERKGRATSDLRGQMKKERKDWK